MKKIYFFLAMLFAGSLINVNAQIAAWDFTGENTVATSAAEIYNANMDASNLLTRGAGAAASAGANSFRTVGFSNNGISTANTDYFQFTLSAATGYSLSLTTIDSRVTGTATYSVTPGVSQQYAYSLDGVSFTLIGSPSVSIGTNQTFSVDLSSVPALQNIADGVTVTFRFYASGQTTTGGWGYFSSVLGQNGLAVAGTLVPTATPSLGVSQSNLAFGSLPVGSASTPSLSFNLSGANLTGAPGNITVTSPSTDFQVSNDDATWGGSTTIAYASPTLSNTPVYVRFTPQSNGSKSGNITFTGGGVAIPPTVALTGIGTQTYYSKSTGTLTNVSNWGDVFDGSGTAPLNFTDDGQIFIVANRGVTVALDANWTVSGAGSKVVIPSVMDFTIPPGFALTGTIDVGNGGNLILENSTIPTLGTLATGIPGSQVVFAQAGTIVVPARTYHHLALRNGTKTLAVGTTTVTGLFAVEDVTGFNGAGSPFSTLDLSGGQFSLFNSTFDPNPAGDGNRITLIASASLGLFSGGSSGDFELFRLQTPATPATSISITLIGSANLLLGNASGGGLNLQQSTHELNLSGRTLTIRGSGIFSSTNLGTITGSSSSNLVIDKTSGAGAIGSIGFTGGFGTLNNLTVNSAGTGNNNFTILGAYLQVFNITLTGGRIVISEGTQIELVTTGLSGTGFGAAKHIVTKVNTSTGLKGTLRVDGITTAFTFPVGDGTNYLPLTVTPSSANDFTVTAFSGITGNGEPNGTPFTAGQKINVVDAVWQVGRFSASGDATLTTEWPAALEGTGFSSFLDAEIGIAHNNGTNWGIAAGTGNNTTNTATRTAISSFSPFGVGKVGLALPVKFANVKAYQQGSSIKIDWSNLTETNVLNYVVERSANGSNFIALNTMSAARNDGGSADYTSLDVLPLNGVNFYRIRSNELDGKSLYSAIVKVNTKGGVTGITIYPNPVTGGQVSLQTTGLSKGLYSVRIFDASGQQVLSQLMNNNGGAATEVIQLPAALKPGMYSLQLSGGDVKLAKSFIIR